MYAWTASDTPAVTVAATVSVAAPANGAASGQCIVCQMLTVAVTGAAVTSGPVVFQLRSGTTVLWTAALSAAIGGSASISLTDLDFRTVPGEALNLRSVAGGGADSLITVSMAGDYVQKGAAAVRQRLQ